MYCIFSQVIRWKAKFPTVLYKRQTRNVIMTGIYAYVCFVFAHFR